MHIDDLRHRLRALGAAPPHEGHLLRRWLRAQPLAGGRRAPGSWLPAPLAAALPALQAEIDALARIAAVEHDAEGAAKLLVALADGRTVESVLLPRGGLCVSIQVGCAVGCGFCATGRDGLLRQLGSAEIAAQLALARTLRPVRRVVFMGMGEPAHNLDAVLEAIALFAAEGGIGHKALVFSTVGDLRVFERLPQAPVQPALALSLHTTKAALRERLLPRAPRIEPAELVALGEAYARTTGHPLLLQWTLIDGVNDGDDEVEALVVLLARRRIVLNLIPLNATEGFAGRRPPVERAQAMARALNARGVYTRLRWSAAQPIDGGCGQLRARTPEAPLRVLPRYAGSGPAASSA